MSRFNDAECAGREKYFACLVVNLAAYCQRSDRKFNSGEVLSVVWGSSGRIQAETFNGVYSSCNADVETSIHEMIDAIFQLLR